MNEEGTDNQISTILRSTALECLPVITSKIGYERFVQCTRYRNTNWGRDKACPFEYKNGCVMAISSYTCLVGLPIVSPR